MAFDYQRFITVLSSNPKEKPSFEDRMFLQDTAKILILSLESMQQEDNKILLIQNLRSLLKSAGGFKACFINALLYHIKKDSKYLKRALELQQKLSVTVADHVNDFWALSLMPLETSKGKKPALGLTVQRQYLRKLNAKIIKAAAQEYEKIVPADEDKLCFTANQRVVIITSQLLGIGHAPTEIAFNYAHMLQKEHGKEVLVVNSCEYSAKPCGALSNSRIANANDQYSDFTHFTYEGEKIGLFQPKPAICSEEGIRDCIRKIDSFDPALIIVVGNSCSFAEAFVGRSYVIYSPTTNMVPYVVDAKFHMHDAPTEEHLTLMKQENSCDNYEFFLPGAYDQRKKHSDLTREELGLPEGKPVFIVVGNRLNLEITDEFLHMVNEICMRGGFFFFLGEYGGYAELEGIWPEIAKNSINHKYQSDIMAVYEHCDVYVNPKRQGGGTSAVYAMQAGVPVLSLPYGDVSFTAEQFPELADYDAMKEAAIRLATSEAALAEYKGLAQEGCKAINGLSGVISKILEHYELHVENAEETKQIAV